MEHYEEETDWRLKLDTFIKFSPSWKPNVTLKQASLLFYVSSWLLSLVHHIFLSESENANGITLLYKYAGWNPGPREFTQACITDFNEVRI